MIDSDLKVLKPLNEENIIIKEKNKLNDIIRYIENIQDCKHYLLSNIAYMRIYQK